MDKLIKTAAFAALSIAAAGALAKDASPKAGSQMRLMIAGFGTIDSIAQVDKWLGEQLQENKNLEAPPVLSQDEKALDPSLAKEVAIINWNTRKTEYTSNAKRVSDQNARDRELLRQLRTKVLTDAQQRYVPMAKDYLQAAIYRRAGALIQVVDRSSADMNFVEQELNGNHDSTILGADCILTAAFGDREEESRTVTVNAKGTQIKTTTYTQPYTYKIRDTSGAVLLAGSGTAQWAMRMNSIVASTKADPARRLCEQACDQMAEKIVAFFTTKIAFKIKTPPDRDAEEVVVKIDDKEVDAEEEVVVLAADHIIEASLDGCDCLKTMPYRLVIGSSTPFKPVSLVFRKKPAQASAPAAAPAPAPAAAPAAAPAPAADADDDDVQD